MTIEDARSVGAGERNKLARRQSTSANTVMPQHAHAIFDTARAVGDGAKVADSCAFLRSIEDAVIGADDADRARLHAAPERRLMFGRTKRRTHHMMRGTIPVRVAIHTVVDHKVLNERFTKRALPYALRARGEGRNGLLISYGDYLVE